MVAVAGCAAAVILVVLAFSSDQLVDPGVRAALGIWITLPYIAAGLIAWWRRPDSRFGLLMIVAGFGTFLNLLTWANSVFLYSIGQAFDFLPPVLLIHLILAFPTGRLERRLEHWIVGAACWVQHRSIDARRGWNPRPCSKSSPLRKRPWWSSASSFSG